MDRGDSWERVLFYYECAVSGELETVLTSGVSIQEEDEGRKDEWWVMA